MERRTLWGFPGYQPFAGAVNVGRVLKFATLLPQTWDFHCSPRSDAPSPDCLGLTHWLVLVKAERGGEEGGGSLQSSRDWPPLDKAPVSFAPARAAEPGGAERSAARGVDPAAPSGIDAAIPRRVRAAERSAGAPRLGKCCGNIAIAL